jgi:F-type H+-transporting ATPase subunit b
MLRQGFILLLCFTFISAGMVCAADSHSGTPDEHSSGPDIFSGGLGTAVFTIAVFVVLLVILGKWAWGPILAGLQKREENIRSSIEEAQRAREEADEALAEYKAQLARARQESESIIEKGRDEALRLAEQLRDKAQQEAQLISTKAERDINVAKNQALKELYEQTTELATEMAAGIIGKTLTPEDHRELLQESLSKLQDTTKKP